MVCNDEQTLYMWQKQSKLDKMARNDNLINHSIWNLWYTAFNMTCDMCDELKYNHQIKFCHSNLDCYDNKLEQLMDIYCI